MSCEMSEISSTRAHFNDCSIESHRWRDCGTGEKGERCLHALRLIRMQSNPCSDVYRRIPLARYPRLKSRTCCCSLFLYRLYKNIQDVDLSVKPMKPTKDKETFPNTASFQTSLYSSQTPTNTPSAVRCASHVVPHPNPPTIHSPTMGGQRNIVERKQ